MSYSQMIELLKLKHKGKILLVKMYLSSEKWTIL